jgi:hypothetical protein
VSDALNQKEWKCERTILFIGASQYCSATDFVRVCGCGVLISSETNKNNVIQEVNRSWGKINMCGSVGKFIHGWEFLEIFKVISL